MSAGMDLSGTLGGLRIANPDADSDSAISPPISPPAAPRASSPSDRDTITARRPDIQPADSYGSSVYESSSSATDDQYQQHQTYQPQQRPTDRYNIQNGASPSSPASQSPRQLNHRSSMGFAQQAAQVAQYQSQQQQGYNGIMRNASVSGATGRPVSGVHTQAGMSTGAAAPGTYRYGGDIATADGSLGGMTRTTSRSTRTYRQGSTQGPGGSGAAAIGSAYPQRRNSQRARATTTGSTSSANMEPTAADSTTSLSTPQQQNSAEAWRERGAAVGRVRETDASGQTHTRIVKKGVKDFHFGRTLGEGSYSTVLAATDRQNGKEYAIKVLDKRHIIKEKKVKYVNIERDTLNRLTEHPGIVRLYYTFQDERSLYFVLDLATGGELLGVLKRLGTFDVECSRFYAAQILDSIAYMHSRGVIHRDLKPENVLLDRDMHVKITDFGTAKILRDPRAVGGGNGDSGSPQDGMESDRAVSFVGTAEYVSPELLRDKSACKASDLWAFGCIVFQLLAGRPPFKAANEYLTFQKILALDYTFPPGFPEAAKDLVERLLVLEPTRRLPIDHIKSHMFFDGLTWGKSLWRQPAPRLKPYVPPPAELIRLNGPSAAAAAAMAGSASNQPPPPLAPLRRPQLMGVTELPPPSQLDIDWAPVLTHNNERILKLGNLIVHSGPLVTSPGANGSRSGEDGTAEDPAGQAPPPSTSTEKNKFARLFSSATTKRTERLVLITSHARLVVAAAGANEKKKAKLEINLASHAGAQCRSCTDAKGLTYLAVDTVRSSTTPYDSITILIDCSQKDKHYTFEHPRPSSSAGIDAAGTRFATQDWLEAIEQAREVAASQPSAASSTSSANALTGGAGPRGGSSHLGHHSHGHGSPSANSPAASLGGDAAMPLPGSAIEGAAGGGGSRHMLRHTLRRGPPSGPQPQQVHLLQDDDNGYGGSQQFDEDGNVRDGGNSGSSGGGALSGAFAKRFSKRHSKSGLAAVF